jgi:hypothetical protein
MKLCGKDLWEEINDTQAAFISGGQASTSSTSEPEFTYPLRIRVSGELNLEAHADLDLKIDLGVQKA